jgi:hypothetical protein
MLFVEDDVNFVVDESFDKMSDCKPIQEKIGEAECTKNDKIVR